MHHSITRWISSAGALCVIDPMEMKSTPVSAIGTTVAADTVAACLKFHGNAAFFRGLHARGHVAESHVVKHDAVRSGQERFAELLH